MASWIGERRSSPAEAQGDRYTRGVSEAQPSPIARPPLPRWRRWLRVLLRAILWFVGLLLTYFALAFGLGRVPVNAGWKPPANGVEIYVCSNGVHTDLVLPLRRPNFDWSTRVPLEHFRAADPGASWVEIGWGDRGFYLEAATWADVRVTTILKALTSLGGSVMHVTRTYQPGEDDRCVRVLLTEEQYAQLATFVERSFARDGAGHFVPIRGRGYWGSDTFYEAVGSYSLLYTCNSWTSEALKLAGVRSGLWTPLVDGVMAHLR